jgi:hypothetical protein
LTCQAHLQQVALVLCVVCARIGYIVQHIIDAQPIPACRAVQQRAVRLAGSASLWRQQVTRHSYHLVQQWRPRWCQQQELITLLQRGTLFLAPTAQLSAPSAAA